MWGFYYDEKRHCFFQLFNCKAINITANKNVMASAIGAENNAPFSPYLFDNKIQSGIKNIICLEREMIRDFIGFPMA